MRIIIAGMGAIGTYLTKMLSDGKHEIVVIDLRTDLLQDISSTYDVMTIEGSATSFSVLKEADVRHSDLFVAVTRTVEVNITACILAKQLGSKKTIARIDNSEYLKPINKSYFYKMGINSIIYPQRLAAREIANLLNDTGTSEVFNFDSDKLSLYVIKLEADAPIIGKKLSEVAINEKNMTFRAMAISRNNITKISDPNDVFLEGDLVYVITNQRGINPMMKFSGTKKLTCNNVMIIGAGRMGTLTAYLLENDYKVKLIEIKKEKSERRANFLNRALVINADGRDLKVLKDEGIEMMDAFIAVTGDDEFNILSCIQAKQLGVKKTIASIRNVDYLHLAESMGIDAIVNKKLIAASHILRYTMRAEVPSFVCLTGSEAEVLEFIVKEDAKITKDTLANTDFPKDAIIGGVIRNNKSFIATGSTHIQPKDRVVVFALPSVLQKVDKFFN